MQNNFTKTIGIALGGVVLVGLVVFGVMKFSGGGSEVKNKRIDTVATDTQQKVIHMIGHWKGEDLRENFVLETVKEFETRHPDVKVDIKWNMDFPGGREGALQATIDQIKNGTTTWDVIWLEPFYYQPIADAVKDQDWAKNNLVDFETVPGFKESQKDFILSDPQYRNHMNGVITGPYIEGFYQPLFYNKVVADKIGLKIKDRGMTFGDLLGYVKTISEYNQKNNTSIPAFYESGDLKGGIGYGPTTWNIFQSLFRSEFSDLKELANIDGITPKKDAALKKTLGSLEQLGKYKPLMKGYEGFDWFGTRQYVLDDASVFTAAGASWMYTHWSGLDKLKTLKMVPTEMPVYQKVGHYMGGYNPMFAVMKNSPVRDLAIELLMGFSTPNSAEKWISYAKAPSGIKGNLSESGDDSKTADQFDKFISYITDTYGVNVYDTKTVDYILGKKYKDLTPLFCQHLVAVMDGKITADQAYKMIKDDMKKYE